jgi:hypothetical protein
VRWNARPSCALTRFMGAKAFQPKFVAFELMDRSGWGALVTLSRGRTRNVHGFKSERDAKAWIKRDSAAWLKRTEGGRYA